MVLEALLAATLILVADKPPTDLERAMQICQRHHPLPGPGPYPKGWEVCKTIEARWDQAQRSHQAQTDDDDLQFVKSVAGAP